MRVFFFLGEVLFQFCGRDLLFLWVTFAFAISRCASRGPRGARSMIPATRHRAGHPVHRVYNIHILIYDILNVLPVHRVVVHPVLRPPRVRVVPLHQLSHVPQRPILTLEAI